WSTTALLGKSHAILSRLARPARVRGGDLPNRAHSLSRRFTARRRRAEDADRRGGAGLTGQPHLGDGNGVTRSDVEAERAHLLASVLGDLLRTPWRHPDPVDAVGGHDPLEGL